jgi:hypothetical protein
MASSSWPASTPQDDGSLTKRKTWRLAFPTTGDIRRALNNEMTMARKALTCLSVNRPLGRQPQSIDARAWEWVFV